MRIGLVLSSPLLRRDSHLFAEVARDKIRSIAKLNVRTLLAYPNIPKLYSSGVRYRLEEPNTEEFVDLAEILRRGWGDCAQLVAWRMAELIRAGEKWPDARFVWKLNPVTGQRYFHVVVRRADGRIEDPSVRLGMNSGDAVTARQKPVRIGR